MTRLAILAAGLALAACAEVTVHCDRCTVFPEGTNAGGVLGGMMGQWLAPKPEDTKPALPRLPKREEP